ncbi:hypothetical protein [Mycobacterium sp. IS-2888]|uniref:DUF6414 family protein n=1 Tax=Mycobacterium sp. IS-2888 TaxID=1834159 RepID=UPI0011156DD1|nr:hypothetical protein [Mycobacterium sp. IS-2888]
MAIYKKPKRRIHRGFQYLDDETVVNSLSAVEAGKVDEVVSKIGSSKEGGLGGSVGYSGASIEGGKKSSTELEEEIVKVRTRFSIFELWYQNLLDKEAIGTFTNWGQGALDDVTAGDTFEVRAEIQIVPFQILTRMYRWYSKQAARQDSPFFLEGAALKEVKRIARNMEWMMGDDVQGVYAKATPEGDSGPPIFIPLNPNFLIGGLGDLAGTFTLIGQADAILAEGDSLPALRFTREVPPTQLEINALKEAIANFGEPAESFGLEWSDNEAELSGPALVARPIAIYR